MIRVLVLAFSMVLGGVAVAAEDPPLGTVSRSEGVVETAAGPVSYQAVAGTVVLTQPTSGAKGRVFYVAYTRTDSDGPRPLSFAFNGGPGASSAFLHLGALGPRRLVLNDDGTVPPPPARLAPNPLTWLAFTDLVFVDPVGTGFSRAVVEKDEDAANKRAGNDAELAASQPFWGVRQDAETVAEFIRLYLTRNQRWLDPKFVIGESYGGVRAATLAHVLEGSAFGVDLSGLVLVSPVLEYALTRGGDYNVLPWAVLVPSYTASALHHGRSSVAADDSGDLDARLAEVERFAAGEFLAALFRGDSADAAAREAFYERLAGYIGLPVELVRRYRGRVPFFVFVRELLRDQGRIAGAYDTSVTGLDTDPGDPLFALTADPTLVGLDWPFSAAFNAYVRNDLGFETDTPYRLLNDEIIEHWDWSTGIGSKQGFVTTAGGLKLAMTVNPSLKLFVAHGYFDLVTPYFGTQFVIDQMNLPAALRGNVTLKRYRGGHMLYTHAEARARFYEDAKAFYARAVE